MSDWDMRSGGGLRRRWIGIGMMCRIGEEDRIKSWTSGVCKTGLIFRLGNKSEPRVHENTGKFNVLMNALNPIGGYPGFTRVPTSLVLQHLINAIVHTLNQIELQIQ